MYYVAITAKAKNAKRHIAGKYETFGQALDGISRINSKYNATICDGKWNVLCDALDASIVDTYVEHANVFIRNEGGTWSIEAPEDTYEYSTFQEMLEDIEYTVCQWMDEAAWTTDTARMGFTDAEQEMVDKVLANTETILFFNGDAYRTEEYGDTYEYSNRADLVRDLRHTYVELLRAGFLD